MSGEIEFVDPEPEPTPPVRPSTSASRWIAALGWTAAAALAAIAPFQRLYGSGSSLPRRYADYLSGSAGSSNGWGNGGVLGPRFGIALVVCAAVCAVLALAAWIRVLGRPEGVRPHRVLAGAAIAAPSLLAGVVGTLALFLRFASNPAFGRTSYGFTSYAPLNQTGPYSSHLAVAFDQPASAHSWCLWLAVGAVLCALVAALAQSVTNRAGRDLAG